MLLSLQITSNTIKLRDFRNFFWFISILVQSDKQKSPSFLKIHETHFLETNQNLSKVNDFVADELIYAYYDQKYSNKPSSRIKWNVSVSFEIRSAQFEFGARMRTGKTAS